MLVSINPECHRPSPFAAMRIRSAAKKRISSPSSQQPRAEGQQPWQTGRRCQCQDDPSQPNSATFAARAVRTEAEHSHEASNRRAQSARQPVVTASESASQRCAFGSVAQGSQTRVSLRPARPSPLPFIRSTHSTDDPASPQAAPAAFWSSGLRRAAPLSSELGAVSAVATPSAESALPPVIGQIKFRKPLVTLDSPLTPDSVRISAVFCQRFPLPVALRFLRWRMRRCLRGALSSLALPPHRRVSPGR